MKLELGQEIPTREYHITRDSLVRYAGASGDFNPIHYRDDIAQSVGLPGVLAHGMLTMGIAVQIVAEFFGDGGKIADYQVRFTKPVVVAPLAGANLVVTGKVAEIAEDGSTARIDLTASFNDAAVLGKAQVRVRL